MFEISAAVVPEQCIERVFDILVSAAGLSEPSSVRESELYPAEFLSSLVRDSE